ncbi:MAG: UDP-N-acetylmuramoyl-tripeptide--D-alanyl-D-alanine ligase [Bacteroidales bacterium]|nr:UDP-N-acetylmuramoyl-tripeptide--D-alanyl-D-alanine ligase [Bacteroidales bacterium]
MEIKELHAIVRNSAGITTDTRKIRKGELFFALKGPAHDGNRFATDSLAGGAEFAVVDDTSLTGDNIIVVENVLATLTELAKYHRRMLTIPVIAITGSNGKTTTKELIAAVLSKKKKVHSTTGNLNNHIGVPLTLLAAPDDAGYLVVEMGANHKGEIAALCEIAMPDIGIITNIGKAHIEGFGSLEDVREAKSELYHWLRNSGGIAIYNERSNTLKELIFNIVHKAVPYSDPYGTDLLVEAAEDDGLYLRVKAAYEGRQYTFTTNLFGSYNIDNVRAAMAVGVFLEVPFSDIIDAVTSYKPANNRSQDDSTDKNILISDTYNANPSSMEKAISSFAGVRAEKKMVILGDMLELGSESEAAHDKVITYLKALDGVDILLAGPLFSAAAKRSGGMISFASTDELSKWLESHPPQCYYILVKGSRGMMLEKLYPLL